MAERCVLDIGPDALVWHAPGVPPRRVALALADVPVVLQELLTSVPSGEVDVRVSACHARLFMLPWAEALNSETRWQSFAHSRFDELFGDDADAWLLRTVPEPPGRARLAVALPRAWGQALSAALGPRLRSLRVDALRRLDSLCHTQPRFTGAVLDLSESHAWVALLVNGRLQRVRLRRMAPGTDELRAMLAVEWAALGRDDSLPALAFAEAHAAQTPETLQHLATQVTQLDASPQAPHHHALDFSASGTRPTRSAQVLAVAGLVALTLAGLWAHTAWQTRSEHHDSTQRLAAAQARRSLPTKAVVLAAPRPGEQRFQAELGKLSADLHRPWFELLDALEGAASTQVQVQQLSVDASFTRAQVQVEAQGLGEVLRYVRALDAASGPVQGAQLASHEWVGAEGGGAVPAAGATPRRLRARIHVALGGVPVASSAAHDVACAGAACNAGRLLR